MYDNLVKRLRERCYDCKFWDSADCMMEGKCTGKDALEAADAIKELDMITDNLNYLYKEATTWIPVTERLPEKDTTVIVCDSYSGYMGIWNYLDDVWEDSYGYYKQIDEVTHWMPLPQPPKEEIC